jgi:hypothetical protein
MERKRRGHTAKEQNKRKKQGILAPLQSTSSGGGAASSRNPKALGEQMKGQRRREERVDSGQCVVVVLTDAVCVCLLGCLRTQVKR